MVIVVGAELVLLDEERLLGQFAKRARRLERPLLSGVEDWIGVGVERGRKGPWRIPITVDAGRAKRRSPAVMG